MPNMLEIDAEYHAASDQVRLRYLKKLHDVTKRNIIVYYSGWLQKPDDPNVYLDDLDIHGFMQVIEGLKRSKGLDLILHTPGGDAAATEALVDYLRAMFRVNIRVIVPQLAMSAGTMIACAAKEILMGKHSSLGPIDPQVNEFPAYGVIREFDRACADIKENQNMASVWLPIISQYHPSLVGECEQWIKWANDLACEWLKTGMFKSQNKKTRAAKAQKIVYALSHPDITTSHNRHLSPKFCKKIGMAVKMMEKNQKLQDAVLSVHHACSLVLMHTSAAKLIMNHNGVSIVQ